jgi:Holliday junction DNA helicase RuvA
MYYHISGELVLTGMNYAVIDCGGVGYKLTVSGNTLGKISPQTGDRVRLFCHLAVREDDLELFGFFEQEELAAFRMLISVSGVGPKAALSVLSLLSPEKFALAVATGDTKLLSKAQGVGAKTAARIILELKDKISKKISSESAAGTGIAESASGSKLADAQNTLMVLGYSRQEAVSALNGIDTDKLELEDIIREALKNLLKK